VPGSRGIASHFGDEVVTVAAVDGAGELDRGVIGGVAGMNGGHDRTAGRDAKVFGVDGGCQRGAETLRGANRDGVSVLQSGVEGGSDFGGIRQESGGDGGVLKR
jgi:hypothetical protein